MVAGKEVRGCFRMKISEGESYYVAQISDIDIFHVLIMRTCHLGSLRP